MVFAWSLDRATKMIASGLLGQHSFGVVRILPVHNSGVLLGSFSGLPAVLRVVSLSTVGAFLLFLFFMIQLLLPSKSLMLRLGLSLLISGIMGNVTDRILWGYVVDFISIGTPGHFSPVFNFADGVQWTGYILLVTAFVKEGKHFWPEVNSRKKYWINHRFQLRYCLILVLCGAGLSAVLGVYSYTYLRVALNELNGPSMFAHGMTATSLLTSYITTLTIVSLCFCGILFGIGLILSHRIAGPLYAFERFLKDLLEGKDSSLKLRAGDEFKQLETLANKIRLELDTKYARKDF